MPDPAPEQLELLLGLQATDSRRKRLRHQLDDLPEQQQLDAAEARLEELSRERDTIRLDLDRASAEQRQLERETDVLTERRDVERARLYDGSVMNQRQLRSVEAEIESTERRIAEHEELLLAVLERVEDLEARARALDDEERSCRERIAALTAARDDVAKELLAELAELETQRERQVGELADDLLTRYEQAVERAGGGAGVGRLEGNACSACRIELSMADVGELMDGPPLTTCPQCRRLLVVLV